MPVKAQSRSNQIICLTIRTKFSLRNDMTCARGLHPPIAEAASCAALPRELIVKPERRA